MDDSMTLLLQQISEGVSQVRADIQGIREALNNKADAAHLREIEARLVLVERSVASDDAVNAALQSVSVGRKAMYTAVGLAVLNMAFTLAYWFITKH